MADRYDDDSFSDTGLDDLPANTLQQLEQNAVSHSQHVPNRQQDRASRSLPDYRAVPKYPLNELQQNRRPDYEVQEPPSSDYGYGDEDVIDLDEPSLVIQPASGPIARDAYREGGFRVGNTASGGAREAWEQRYVQQQEPQLAQADLHRRITELERERAILQKSVEDAKADAESKAGATSILRSRLDKATKEFERKLAVMQSMHADEAAKQKAEIEATKKERETVQTNNRFLEHDLAQEVERAKRIKSNAMNGANGDQSRPSRTHTTPRKNHNLPYRDGFDDHEIVAISPLKSREKKKGETPKAGAKRKRLVDASPIPLAMSQPKDDPLPEVWDMSPPNVRVEVSVAPPDRQDMTVRTMQQVLNHAPYSGHDGSVESLVKYAFPSSPGISISSLLLHDLSSFRPEKNDLSMAIHVCFTCLELWSKCLAEKYFAPLYLLLDLFEHVLIGEPSASHIAMIERFNPLAAKTIDLIAVPLARSASNPAYETKIDKSAQAMLEDEVDVNHILSLMHMIAMGASFDQETAARFWRNMEFDFVLLMLNKAQELPQITLVLQMVGSSTLMDTFGAINSDSQIQARNETSTIDRLTSLLFDHPAAPAGEDPYDRIEMGKLRVEILDTIGTICQTNHGSSALAQHRSAIGRLIRFLDLQITSLYSTPLPQADQILQSASATTTHGLISASINRTTRLLYQLLHNHTELIDLREKLAVVHGGHHKFLIAFARLGFSSQLAFEADIDVEVVDAAHEILDAVLSPEEGDAIMEAVETPRGSASRMTSVPVATVSG